MNPAESAKSELLKLADAACEQQLSREDAARLEELVTGDKQLRQLYKLYVELHAAAERYLPRLVEVSDVTEESALSDAESDREWAQLASQEALANGSRRRTVPWLVTTLVLLLLVAGAWFFAAQSAWFADVGKSSQIATLTKTANCRWNDGQSKEVGSRLAKDETISLLEGLAEIEFDNGATVVLDGPATFILTAGAEGYLLKGKLVANVPEPAVGFTIRAPNARVVDLGTEFGLQVPEIGATEVHVFEGEVEVTYFDTRTDLTETIVLHEKDAALVDTAALAISEATADRDRFKFDASETTQTEPDRFREQDGVVAFEAEAFTRSSGVGRHGETWRVDAASRNEFANATGRRFVQLADDGTQTQFGAFQGAWLDYDFTIATADTYRVWLFGAATGYGPNGRPGEVVELTEMRYRSDAFTGSRAIKPIKTNFNRLIGLWQIGDGVPTGEATVPQFDVGSRLVNQRIPQDARKIFLALHDNFQWTNNAGQVSARVVWQQENITVPIRVDDVIVDAKGCIWFAWATDEQLGGPSTGKGPYQESTNQRPLALDVPQHATTVSISSSGTWSHLEQIESFPSAVQIKLIAVDELGTPNETERELVQTSPIALAAGQNFQWTLATSQGQALNPGDHRLRLYAASPAAAIDRIVTQRASAPKPN